MSTPRELKRISEVFAFAERRGISLAPRHIPRAEAVAWCRRSVRATDLAVVADAFIASLITRRLDLPPACSSPP